MSGEHYSARKHPEFVVLDIGEDLGALIVHTEREMHGVEVEISPTGDDGRRTHKEVLERSIDGRPAFTAVFDRLEAGSYKLWVENEVRARKVMVEGGAIAELDWRGLMSPSNARRGLSALDPNDAVARSLPVADAGPHGARSSWDCTGSGSSC